MRFTKSTKVFLIAIVITAAFLIGCVKVKTVPYESEPRAPKPPDYPIEIIDTHDIDRPYKVIGLVQANAGKKHSVEDTLEKLRDAARKMGADALLGGCRMRLLEGPYRSRAGRYIRGMCGISGGLRRLFGSNSASSILNNDGDGSKPQDDREVCLPCYRGSAGSSRGYELWGEVVRHWQAAL